MGILADVLGGVLNPLSIALILVIQILDGLSMLFTDGSFGSWRILALCQEMSFLEWWVALFSLLALVFYLLFFVADILLQTGCLWAFVLRQQGDWG